MLKCVSLVSKSGTCKATKNCGLSFTQNAFLKINQLIGCKNFMGHICFMPRWFLYIDLWETNKCYTEVAF